MLRVSHVVLSVFSKGLNENVATTAMQQLRLATKHVPVEARLDSRGFSRKIPAAVADSLSKVDKIEHRQIALDIVIN